MAGLSSVGLISKGSGIMWVLSTSMGRPGNPGSLPGPGTGLRRAPLTSGAISSLPGVLKAQLSICYDIVCTHVVLSQLCGVSGPGEGSNFELLVLDLSGHRHCAGNDGHGHQWKGNEPRCGDREGGGRTDAKAAAGKAGGWKMELHLHGGGGPICLGHHQPGNLQRLRLPGPSRPNKGPLQQLW